MVKPFAQSTTRRKRRPSRPVPRPDTRDGQTEQRILDAAHAVFTRAGTAGARTLEIAREAGVNPALLHYYFRTKERLAQAVFARAARQLLPAVLRILASDRTLDVKVREVVEIEIAALTSAPYLPAYILSELAHHPDRLPQLIAAVGVSPEAVSGTVLRTLTRQIDAEVRAGRLRPIGADQFLVNLLALCVFPFAARPMLMVLLRLDAQGFGRFIDRRRADLASFFLQALRP